jgi:hypothetical protein
MLTQKSGGSVVSITSLLTYNPIAGINANVKQPHQAIPTVHRSDGSGTTFNFTDSLRR